MGILHAAQTSLLSHASALADPIPSLSALIAHLLSAPIHPIWLPFPQFQAIHAVKISLVWALMTRETSRKDVGRLGDLLGYLALAWGGGTMSSLLLGQPPSWLIAPGVWAVYPAAYLLLVPTGMASYITKTAPSLLLNLAFAAIDGMTRGTTIASLPPALATVGTTTTWWTLALLSAITTTGGGWIVSLFGLNEGKWTLHKPHFLDGGLLNTLDVWGAMLVALINDVLRRAHPELDSLFFRVLPLLPSNAVTLGPTDESPAFVHPEAGRAICVLLMGSLLAGRAVLQAASTWRKEAKKARKATKKKDEADLKVRHTEKKITVVKSPAMAERTRATPRKSPKPRPP